MAVKKHELGQIPRQLDLNALVKYLLNEHIQYLSHEELIKNCQKIVKCLARTQGSHSSISDSLQIVEDYLVRIMNLVPEEIRHEIVNAILHKFNQYISDPQSKASAATSVVLVALNYHNDTAASTTRWLVQQSDSPEGIGLRASLNCLYAWICEWGGTSSLGNWVMAFIKALEENNRYDILIEVSVKNLGHLFSTMDDPGELRLASTNVIFHVLSSLRESKEALDMVTPHVNRVLNNLASDSSQFSRHLLQITVDILTEMMYGLASVENGLRNEYWEVIVCLERHMASRGCAFLQLPPWRGHNVFLKPPDDSPPLRKVGLDNLGNTCYMNSVFQVLLLTKQFSTHVMMEMNSVPYWAKLGVLFAKMLHSISNRLNPEEFIKIFRPSFFTLNNQHDSSEFLGYLLELLKTFEHCTDENFDYSKPAMLHTTQLQHSYRLRSSTSQSTSTNIVEIDCADRRSVSPSPSSSGSVSCSATKRPGKTESMLPRKRIRLTEPALRRDSFIDNMFSGVLLTRVVCTFCHSTFLSRDAFRELQLAFPEKPDNYEYSVQKLLEYYCSEEKLTGDNRYRCRECGVLRDAERSVLVEAAPKYLILVLKNFKYDPTLKMQTKLMNQTFHNYYISLPTDHSQVIHSSYTLYAAVVHTGTTLDSGHYYSLAKDKSGWHSYNDASVTAASEIDVNKLRRCCTPYVLFYRRTDIVEGKEPALENLPQKMQEQVFSHNKKIVAQVRNQRRIGRP